MKTRYYLILPLLIILLADLSYSQQSSIDKSLSSLQDASKKIINFHRDFLDYWKSYEGTNEYNKGTSKN